MKTEDIEEFRGGPPAMDDDLVEKLAQAFAHTPKTPKIDDYSLLCLLEDLLNEIDGFREHEQYNEDRGYYDACLFCGQIASPNPRGERRKIDHCRDCRSIEFIELLHMLIRGTI